MCASSLLDSTGVEMASKPEAPKFSVVIPAKNAGATIKQAIESVLCQDYPNKEVIVCSSGNDAAANEILLEYGDKIRWVSKEDDGHADAINKGWALATGNIVCWLNADDALAPPDALSAVARFFAENPKTAAVHGVCGGLFPDGTIAPDNSYVNPWSVEKFITLGDHCIAQPACFVQKWAADKCGLLNNDYVLLDREYWIRLSDVGEIGYLDKLLAYARRGDHYWLSRSERPANECVKIVEDYFSRGQFPESIKAAKNISISNAYLVGAGFLAQGGKYWRAHSFLLYSLLYHPANVVRAVSTSLSMLDRSTFSRRTIVPVVRAIMWALIVMYNLATRIYEKVLSTVSPVPGGLRGERDIEYAWVAAKIPERSGTLLDVGASSFFTPMIGVLKGYQSTAIDLLERRFNIDHDRLSFKAQDVNALLPDDQRFDVVLMISTIEHVGLPGRYNIRDGDADLDLAAMRHIAELLERGGSLILTTPVGVDTVFPGLHRVYGKDRLPKLLASYAVEEETYWRKCPTTYNWQEVTRDEALAVKPVSKGRSPQLNSYALGCFRLTREDSNGLADSQ